MEEGLLLSICVCRWRSRELSDGDAWLVLGGWATPAVSLSPALGSASCLRPGFPGGDMEMAVPAL